MFCPNCGSADQTENSYCRSCGEFLIDSSKSYNFIYNFFGINSPEKQITVNLTINFIGLMLSVMLIGFLKGYYDAGANKNPPVITPNVIYYVYAFLVLISIWQILGIIFAANLRSKFKNRKSHKESEKIGSAGENKAIPFQMRDALPTAKLDDLTTPAIVEETTKKLVKNHNRSSQTEQ